MKKTTLFFFFTLIIKLSYTQGYLDTSSVWYEVGGYFNGVNETHSLYCKLTISGDTLINNKNYYKLHSTGVDSVYNFQTGNHYTLPINQHFASIREDSSKFYHVGSGFTTERLLYDFNLNVGDTIYDFLSAQSCVPKPSIVSIDTVYLGTNPRKRFHLSNSQITFIEGVGASTGLTGMLCQYIEAGGAMICFSQGNDHLIVDSSYTCNILTQIQQNESRILQTKVFPNPFSYSTTIEFLNEKNRIFSLTIYNTLGQISKIIDNITTGEVKIERSTLTTGLYFFRLHSDKEVFATGKLMIE